MGKSKVIKLTGDEALNAILAKGRSQVAIVVGQALAEEARVVMRESLQEVPVRDGFLKASSEVKPPKFSNGLVKVTMGYGGAASKYALIVHNGPERNWTRTGSKSHFLSDPLAAATARIGAGLARRIGKILGR
ncbi:minor tail protein [Microbacterium phage ValentiniPuff]|uniref:Minor tail protein n=1 Tax=Microbacterium phage ValentiniPuff TaxID=2315705 RepID=A0A386KSP2_9CAUD|nr:minor tail protein [Microbacterium phage ValentiniPuff]